MRRAVLFVVAAALALAPLDALAQNEGGPPAADSTELVFEREVFEYPEYERRNPFAPLLSAAENGPRFERLRLVMIIVDDADPSRSIATFTEDTEDAEQRRSYRRRLGERIGNSTVVEIREREVVLDVDDFGVTERRILGYAPRIPGQGGPK